MDVCGRDKELELMTRYCDNESSITPLVVIGGTGTGKTALMIKFMQHYTDRYGLRGDERVMLSKGWRHRARMFLQAHFTTVNAVARNPARMLQNFCTAIAQHYFLEEDDMPGDYAGLCKRFLAYVPQVGASFRGDALLVIVDSIEVCVCMCVCMC